MKIVFLIGGLFLAPLFAKDVAMSQNKESGERFDQEITPIKSIGLSWVLVDDLKESVKFYTEVVGFTLVRFDETEGWAELSGSDGGTRLGLGQKSDYVDIHPGQNAIVSLPVDDILTVKADLMKKGVQMLGEIIDFPGLLKLQTFIDLDGNCFQLIQLTQE